METDIKIMTSHNYEAEAYNANSAKHFNLYYKAPVIALQSIHMYLFPEVNIVRKPAKIKSPDLSQVKLENP